ncbi:uncharacterized protein LOC127129137 [Lathyrus oleraceus]|uniref:uncharacterized protein LOC127129137 n=1 Tax=Pisum sativum TaxID=3888 RepID=UPI0021D2AA28|nr:uncharacterized protein LOC127129137 [Pisum sativum]
MTTNTSNNILRSILEKEKLFGTNFLDWYRNMRIVLKHDKGEGKEVVKPKPTIAALKPSGGITKEGTCFHCGKTGHWKRNCPKNMEAKKNGVETSTSGTKKE